MKNSGELLWTLLLLALISSCTQKEAWQIDLSGEWNYRLDRDNKGVSEKWYNTGLTDTLLLPGSLAENGIGDNISIHTSWTSQIVDSSWYTAEE